MSFEEFKIQVGANRLEASKCRRQEDNMYVLDDNVNDIYARWDGSVWFFSRLWNTGEGPTLTEAIRACQRSINRAHR